LIYKRSYFVGAHIKYLVALAVLSVMSILLLIGFVGELETQDAQTEEESTSDINQEIEEETPTDINQEVEEETPSDINQEVEETKSSLSSYITGFGGIPLTKANVPVTIPLHQGYYNGKGVYHIITDSSDLIHADNITKTQGWEVNLAPLLANATKDALLKTYVFTNGLPGDGVYGFQGQVFTSTPAQADAYSALTSHVHVTWSPAALPRVLISEKEIFSAVQQRLVFLTPQNVVLNMPQIVWPEGQMLVKENKTLTNETPFVGGSAAGLQVT